VPDDELYVFAEHLCNAGGKARVVEHEPDLLLGLVECLEHPCNKPILNKLVARQEHPVVLAVRCNVYNVGAILENHVHQVRGPLRGVSVIDRDALAPKISAESHHEGTSDPLALVPY